MVGRQDSWTKEYSEVVEFEVPLLATPPTPSPSLPSMSFAQAQGPAQAQIPQSMSQPARLSPPAAAVGGQHPPPPPPHDPPTTPHHDDIAHHNGNGSNPAPFARPSNHSSFKNLPSSPLNPASPPHQHHHQNHPMPSTPPVAGAPHGGNHLPSPFGAHTSRPGSRGSLNFPTPSGVPNFSRMANEELRAMNAASSAGPYPSNLTSSALGGGSRGSMILYRRADSFVGTPILAGEDGGQLHFLPPPPVMGGHGFGGGGSNRGSMYSVSGDSIVSMATGGGGLGDSKYPPSLFSGGASTPGGVLSPPIPRPGTMHDNRTSMFSDNRGSMAFSTFGGGGGLVAYAYDPDEDDDSEDDEDDWLHDPEVAYPKTSVFRSNSKKVPRKSTSSKAHSEAPITGENGGATPSASSNGGHSSTTATSDLKAGKQAGVAVPTAKPRQPDPSKIPPNFHGLSSWSWRGLINIATLVLVITALLCLFAVYPIVRMGMDEGVASRITGNTRINATGQAVEDGVDTGGDNVDTTTTGTRARPTATELNPQGGGGGLRRRDLPVALAEPLPSFPSFPTPTYVAAGQIPIVEEVHYDWMETQGIVQTRKMCVTPNHGVEVEVGYSVGEEEGKAFWFNGEWRLQHQYLNDQPDSESRPATLLLGAKKPFANSKNLQAVTVSVVVGIPAEKELARVRYVKFHQRPLSNSRVISGGRLKYKYGSKAKLALCDLDKMTSLDVELEMGDVIARIAKGNERS